MKNFKRIASVVMVLMMMLSMMLPAMAADGDITITGGVADEVYKAYKIFDASISGDNVSYTVDAGSTWETILYDTNARAVKAPFNTYINMTLSADGTVYVVEWINADKTDSPEGTNAAQDFALELEKVVTDDMVTKTATATADGATFTGLDKGYYLIISPVGSKVLIDTTKGDITIKEKNTYPSVAKERDKEFAQIGDTVTYTITVTVPATVDKEITVHDTIEDGLTLNKDYSVKVGETALTNDDYKVVESTDDECSFHIILNATNNVVGKTVVITYTAELDQDAEYDPETNDNTAWITYSEFESKEVIVKTKTLIAEIQKTDEAGNNLAGAKFKLYDDKNEDGTGKELIEVFEVEAGVYRVADDTETGIEEMSCDADGKLVIKGLDKKTYYLKETVAPVGYNKLSYLAELEVVEATNTTSTPGEGGESTTTVTYYSIDVVNKTGTELPSTGGIGTTIFYCAGAILAVGAFVLLITKKRMGKEV